MNSFLEYVAKDILSKYGDDLAHIAVVFPNKRASLFLNEHLARLANKPIWSPAYITISDLFRRHSQRKVADPIKLVCDLHRSFTSQTGIDETLDHFYGWGQLLLNDFDDIDKQMADADRVFANLSDLHEMDDDSFLTEEQRQVLRRFFSNFSTDHQSELRQRFIRLWSKMGDIYHDFNHRLQEQQLAYEGSLYKEVVTAEEQEFQYDIYLFVGFNVLLKVEQRLFTLLRRQGKARFYWDFDKYYMEKNEAGHFISQYLSDFPNEFDIHDSQIYDCFRQPKNITIASASTENIQARYAATWLKELMHKKEKESEHEPVLTKDTAIVLCNEGLLPAIIHCLPDQNGSVNITTGYPLSQSPIGSLINQLIALRRDGYDHQQEYFRLRQVSTLLRHPYMTSASPEVSALLIKLTDEKIYFPTRQQLSIDNLTSLLFKSFAEQHQNTELLTWLCDVVQQIAKPGNGNDDVLRQESLFRTYTLLNRLLNLSLSGDLCTDIITLGRLISQIMQTSTVPFHGEPAEGLQVMGVLETRNLDFDHLLVLGCNEGNVPKSSDIPSFIPFLLREAFELTTPFRQDSVYAYHFYRMLQRAKDVTLVYGNVTDSTNRGERSRFMSQLLVESGKHISQKILQTNEESVIRTRTMVEKDADIQSRLSRLQRISPSALNKYMRCELLFYYSYILGIRDHDDNLDGEIDNKLFGSIFHDASEFLYDTLTGTDRASIDKDHPFAGPGKAVSKELIEWALKEESGVIDKSLTEAFEMDLFGGSGNGGHRREYNGLQLLNRQVIRHYLEKLLSLDLKTPSLSIRGLEGDAFMDFQFEANGETLEKEIGGRIDRLDETEAPNHQGRCIRVVDYKTGAKLPSIKSLEEVFSTDAVENHSDYFFQVMLYSMIVSQSEEINPHHLPVSPALLFIQKASEKDYTPVISFSTGEGKKNSKLPIDDIRPYISEFRERLAGLLGEIFDYSYPFHPTTHIERCINCDLKDVCGKMEKR